MCLAAEMPVDIPHSSSGRTSLIQQLQLSPNKLSLSSKRFCRETAPTPRKKRKLQKRVRMMESENELYYRAYDNEDLKAAWMQQSDFVAVKEGNRHTLKAIIKACNELSEIDPLEHCMRGLERHIETIFFKSTREETKYIVRQVLRDQASLRDADSISTQYRMNSKPSTRQALQRACGDAL